MEKFVLVDFVVISYWGIFLSGFEFDVIDDGEIVIFFFDDLIEGWKIGIFKYGCGGLGKLLVFFNLGYGFNCIGLIFGNFVFVFDIELFDFY